MRRVLVALAAMALALLSLGAPASAAPAEVMHFSFHGSVAEADWSIGSAAGFTDTLINASASTKGAQLVVRQINGTVDANGNFAGGTETTVDITSGFSFAIDLPKLTSATVSASDAPGTTCTVDANFKETGCSDVSIDLNASWTGQGPIGRSVSNSHFKQGGVSITDHFSGTSREATATGLIEGLTLAASDVQFANLGTAVSGTTKICLGC